MDELEGLVEPRGYDPEDVRAIEGSKKRPQIENGSAGETSTNGSTPAGESANKKAKTSSAPAPAAAPPQGKGILSGSALASLQKAAALRKAKQQKAAAAAASSTEAK